MHGGRRLKKWLVQGLCAAVVTGGVLRVGEMKAWGAETLDEAARRLLADVLVEDARTKSRDGSIPVPLAIRETSALLQAAAKLDPTNPMILRHLAEAARVAKQTDLLRETLRMTIKADPGNLVAQVQYLELLALSSQTVDDRLRVYQSAMGNKKLDPQVRSEMAVRVARLMYERGDTEETKKMLAAALQLNDLNVGALQDVANIAANAKAPAMEQLKAQVAILLASPYQPDSWIAGGQILARNNLHEDAAMWLLAGLEQLNFTGVQSPKLLTDLAVEYGIANKRAEAEPLFRAVTGMPDAPLEVLLAAQVFGLTAVAAAPAVEGAAATTQLANLPERIREKLAARVKAEPEVAEVLAEALTLELMRLPEISSDFQGRLDAYKKVSKPTDTAYVRIEGLFLLRAGKAQEAKEKLELIADKDLMAQVARATACVELKQTEEARQILQDIWLTQPTGLVALEVAQTARRAGITLRDTQKSKEFSAVVKQVPATTFTAHRQPRDFVLIFAELSKRRYGLGEAVVLTVKQTNTADRALPVGPAGVVKTTVGLAGTTRGMDSLALGMFALDDVHRTYRLERRSSLEFEVRVDQGMLADIFRNNPLRAFPVSMTLLTAPRGTAKEFAIGLGGQVVATGDFDRAALPLRTLDDVMKLAAAVPSMSAEQQLRQAYLLAAVLPGVPAPNDATPAQEAANLKTARAALEATVLPFMQSGSPIVRAWMFRMAPRIGLTPELYKAVDVPPTADAGASPAENLAAQMMFAQRLAATGLIVGGEVRAGAIKTLTAHGATEKEPLTKEWLGLLVEELGLAGSATAPGSVKEQVPDVGAATESTRTRSDKAVTAPTATRPANAEP